ncbi:hypothetical protein A1O3_03268 [Capronia epimyces CBS 606.96]|uniref:TauD/TfdA-like domain-containing protein n=1 Tax=Capronia epimyces CBS 606.96 TaxID=1182542 RepID=W9Y0I4_9EURO|nr:uncharacterized protein A1O3_03268 [Capronia epimyces CBS 606.96]EXJ86317.1 hypothetical protein A1O3_03268 [Capronia epimyces CBS 606.96]
MSTATALSSLPVSTESAGQLDPASVQFKAFDVPGSRTVHGKAFPLALALEDNTSPSLSDVNAHIKQLADRGTIRDLLTQHGVILFRGLPIETPKDLSSFVDSFNFVRPHKEVGLSGKRTTVVDNIKTASEMPSNAIFHFHNEYARSAHFPELIFFWSELVPQQGGQTPLLSSLELYDRVKQELPELHDQLIFKGIIGRQYYPSKEDPDWKEIGWNWKDSYGFEIEDGDSLEVQHQKVEAVLEKYLQATGEWQSNGSLHVLQHVPAIRRVKSTGVPTFFNGLAGTYGSAKLNGALEPPYRIKNGKGYKLPTSFGDGSRIPSEWLDRLIEIQEAIQFLVPWQRGDVALVNNYTVQVIGHPPHLCIC